MEWNWEQEGTYPIAYFYTNVNAEKTKEGIGTTRNLYNIINRINIRRKKEGYRKRAAKKKHARRLGAFAAIIMGCSHFYPKANKAATERMDAYA